MHSFSISYRIKTATGEDIDQKIEAICLEQSVELPRSALSKEIEANVTGQVTGKRETADGIYEVTISWPHENVAGDISQFLNMLYGNISLQRGIRIVNAEWADLSGDLFGGPAFGIHKLRTRFSIGNRALSGTALKPLGSSAETLGSLCYEFACGGIDIIKDDHGLTNQPYAPFDERVKACVNGIQRAADETGRRSYYFPNITAEAENAVRRYRQAAELGADGVLICPHITGLETMHQLACMDIPLPLIAHPSFSGSLTTDEDRGFTPGFLYGQLWRALGADFSVFPNTGGRFSFTLDECKTILTGVRNSDVPFATAFPVPAGGMSLDTIPKWLETYGTDTMFLLGGSLYNHPGGVREAAQELSAMLKQKNE